MSTMQCFSCKKEGKHLVEVYLNSWGEHRHFDSSKPQRKVCGKCLVTWSVPVFRANINSWQFGRVESYNEQTSEHMIRFQDGMLESIYVPIDTFFQYLNHCRGKWNAIQKARRRKALLSKLVHYRRPAFGSYSIASPPRIRNGLVPPRFAPFAPRPMVKLSNAPRLLVERSDEVSSDLSEDSGDEEEEEDEEEEVEEEEEDEEEESEEEEAEEENRMERDEENKLDEDKKTDKTKEETMDKNEAEKMDEGESVKARGDKAEKNGRQR